MTSTAVSIWSGETWEPDGSEEIERLPGDIKLVSSFSKMEFADKHVGEFHHSDRGGARAFSTELDIVPLIIRTSRTFFESNNDEPLCRSNDGKTIAAGQPLWTRESVRVSDKGPLIEVPRTEPSGCETCPFSRWEGNNEPPLCGEAKVLLAMRKDDETPARFRVSGKGIGPLVKWIRQNVVNEHRPLYSWRVKVTTSRVQQGQKIWYDLKFNGVDLDLDEARAYRNLVAAQRQRFEMPEEQDAEFDAPARASNAGAAYDEVADENNFTEAWRLFDSLGATKGDIREDIAAILAPGTLRDLEPMEWPILADDMFSAAEQTSLTGLTASQRKQMVLVARAERAKRTQGALV